MINNKKIILKFCLKAFHPYYLNNFIYSFYKKFKSNLIFTPKIVSLPKKIERFTVLRSPHVDKKARDQFERITYKRVLILEFSVLNNKEYLHLYNILSKIAENSTGVSVKLTYSS